MLYVFKNLRTGEIAKVKPAVAADIISILDVPLLDIKVWDKIEVIDADYSYVATMQGNNLRAIYPRFLSTISAS